MVRIVCSARFLVALIFSGLIFLPHFAGGADNFDTTKAPDLYSCERLISEVSITPFEGDPLPSNKLQRAYLGSGPMGGIVTRVTDPQTGESWVEKDFHETEMFLNDRLAFAITYMAFMEDPHAFYEVVQVLEVDELNERMKLEWVQGEPLDKRTRWWRDAPLSEENLALLQLYKGFVKYYVEVMDRFLAETDLNIKLQNRDVSEMDASYWLEYDLGDGVTAQVDLMIKPDNIVIRDWPRQMVLIDPF